MSNENLPEGCSMRSKSVGRPRKVIASGAWGKIHAAIQYASVPANRENGVRATIDTLKNIAGVSGPTMKSHLQERYGDTVKFLSGASGGVIFVKGNA